MVTEAVETLKEATLEKGGKTGWDIPFPSSLLEVRSWDSPRCFLCPIPIHNMLAPTVLESLLHSCLSLGHPNVPLSSIPASHPVPLIIVFSSFIIPFFSKDFSIY